MFFTVQVEGGGGGEGKDRGHVLLSAQFGFRLDRFDCTPSPPGPVTIERQKNCDDLQCETFTKQSDGCDV